MNLFVFYCKTPEKSRLKSKFFCAPENDTKEICPTRILYAKGGLCVTVYADILFIVNLYIDAMLLAAVRRFLRLPIKTWRLLLAAALGGLFGLSALLPHIGGFPLLLLGLAQALALAAAAFAPKPPATLLKAAYLLLFGALPTRAQLTAFEGLLSAHRALPPMFTEDMILKAPSPDVMNKLARSVLALYSYDGRPDDMSLPNQLRQAVELIARVPVIVAHAFAAKRHYYDNESLYLHRPQEGLSVAQNFLYSVRHDNRYTDEEARLLDLCLVLHAEHGGGNNSAFACRVLSSSGTDIYSSIAAAVDSLKGPRHGGANKKVMEMFGHIEAEVSDWTDDDAVRDYLGRLLRKEAGDRSGLIYGMGHAIYTLSDPRAVLLKRFARSLAETKGMLDEFELFERVERLTPEVLRTVKGEEKVVCANVDLFSGLVYKMMGIPMELYTPLFAVARMVGWCAHRIEEVCQPANRIIRPAYKAVAPMRAFVPLDQR